MSQETMTASNDMMQGANNALNMAGQGVDAAKKGANDIKKVARGVRRSAKAAKKGAKAAKTVGKLIPLKAKIAIGVVLGLLLIVVLITSLSSNAQTRRMSYLTPQEQSQKMQAAVSEMSNLSEDEREGRFQEGTVTRKTGSTYTTATYDGPEYETKEELNKLLYDRKEIVKDSRELLLEVATAKSENRLAIQEEAINEARRLNSSIDLNVTAASVQYETANDLEIVGDSEVDLLRVSGNLSSRVVAEEGAAPNSGLVAIAQAEVGKLEASKYWTSIVGSRFVNGDATPWCACFVSWCLNQAGVPESVIERSASSKIGWRQYEGTPYAHVGVANYTPVPGDIVSWLWPKDEADGWTRSHVGIVESYSNGVMTTIEGNTDPTKPIRRSWTFSADGRTAYNKYGYPGKVFFIHLPINVGGEVALSDKVSPTVLRYKSQVQAECNAAGISDYWPYILAIMQAESGGRSEDIMQSSESLGLAPNSLSTNESIRQGVIAFKTALKRAQGKGITDIETVIQAYNYGPGFCDYVAKNGGAYTLELAEEFSRVMAGSDRKIRYVNAISTAHGKEYIYGYGNFHYVDVVKQYITGTLSTASYGTAITKKDYQLLAAYSIMLSNGQTIKGDNGEILSQQGIPLKRNWNLLSLFDGTFGQIDYKKTLRSAIKDLTEGTGIIFRTKGEGFYTYDFAKNADGGYIFYGEREITEWRWYTEEEIEEIRKAKEGETGPPEIMKPGNPRRPPEGEIEMAIGTPGGIEHTEENKIPGETGEYITTIETYSYMKPIIKERPLKDVVETLFKMDVNEPYVGSMFDADGDGFADKRTGSATIREAIYTLAEETFALLTNDGKDIESSITPKTGGILGCPLKPKEGGYPITSHFGPRYDAAIIAVGGSTYHQGVDIGIPTGTPILSAEAGEVTHAGWWGTGGNTVIIKHDNGYKTVYCHLSSFKVSVGERVTRGQEVALSGNTGASTGPHLHFGVYDTSGKLVNPLPLLGHDAKANRLIVKEISTVGTGTYAAPLPSGRYRFTQDFGRTTHSSFHNGIDLACPVGTNVYAVAEGTVIMAGKASDYGIKFSDGTPDTAWGVKVRHSDGTVSIYWHLEENSVIVAVGERVQRGQRIGRSGNTGKSSGPHLHLEIRSGNTAVDPKPYLGITVEEGKDVIF